MVLTENNHQIVADWLGISVGTLLECKLVLVDDKPLTGKIISLDFCTGDLVVSFGYHDLDDVGRFYPVEFTTRLGYFRLVSPTWSKSFIPSLGVVHVPNHNGK